MNRLKRDVLTAYYLAMIQKNRLRWWLHCAVMRTHESIYLLDKSYWLVIVSLCELRRRV